MPFTVLLHPELWSHVRTFLSYRDACLMVGCAKQCQWVEGERGLTRARSNVRELLEHLLANSYRMLDSSTIDRDLNRVTMFMQMDAIYKQTFSYMFRSLQTMPMERLLLFHSIITTEWQLQVDQPTHLFFTLCSACARKAKRRGCSWFAHGNWARMLVCSWCFRCHRKIIDGNLVWRMDSAININVTAGVSRLKELHMPLHVQFERVSAELMPLLQHAAFVPP